MAKSSYRDRKFLKPSCPLQLRWTHAHSKSRISNSSGWPPSCSLQRRIQTPSRSGLSRAGHPHSVLHADETPMEMLKPGNKKTHRAYL